MEDYWILYDLTVVSLCRFDEELVSSCFNFVIMIIYGGCNKKGE